MKIMLDSLPLINCCCPVCFATFAILELDQTRRWRRDRENRVFYPCDQKHSMIEIWQAWRRVYGLEPS